LKKLPWFEALHFAAPFVHGVFFRILSIAQEVEGSTMVILHGFIKKQQATPKQDLDLAKERLKILKRK